MRDFLKGEQRNKEKQENDMKKPENIFEKLFGSFSVGSNRVPIRSNIYNKGGRGYSQIGTTSSKLYSSS